MSDKIYIGIDNKRIEAKGEVLESLLQAQAEAQAEQSRIEAEQQAKANAKQSAMNKLKALGLTDNEIEGLMG
jgi:regulator of protease activity HflC (stomatin/prohibitin superfamily)